MAGQRALIERRSGGGGGRQAGSQAESCERRTAIIIMSGVRRRRSIIIIIWQTWPSDTRAGSGHAPVAQRARGTQLILRAEAEESLEPARSAGWLAGWRLIDNLRVGHSHLESAGRASGRANRWLKREGGKEKRVEKIYARAAWGALIGLTRAPDSKSNKRALVDFSPSSSAPL